MILYNFIIRRTVIIGGALVVAFLTSCGGGSDGGSTAGGSDGSDFGCDGGCASQSLSSTEVGTIVSQSVAAAAAVGRSANIAVLDRVGNVLALYQMSGATATTRVDGKIGASGGLEGAVVPATAAAISKAGTGAYLSSQGNAFSSRTASQIIQENFNPGDNNQPSGPLFGVQFSQLPCSDITTAGSGPGPHGLPLGLSADPGGIPLYKSGDLVGGIGVEIDGAYTLDRSLTDRDNDVEELVALAGSIGFEAPSQRVGSRNFAGGRSLRYTDASYADVEKVIGTAPATSDAGGYLTGPVGGTTFGTAASGIVNTVRAGLPASALISSGGGYPGRNGASLGGKELTANEVNAILDSALTTSFRSRAAIRRPLDSGARVSIWVVDHLGTPLGFTRGQDAPVFGIDVSLQKARTAAFFSSTDSVVKIGGYGANLAALAGNVSGIAFGARTIGNLARPFFVDGINGNGPGPLSLPFPGLGSGSTWSPFNTGLQLDLVAAGIVSGLSNPNGSNCTDSGLFGRRIANGLQIFPGGVPLYRAGTLVGGIGVSGDGVDQDDMIAYYGASRRGLSYIGRDEIGDPELGFNAPREIRADTLTLTVGQTRLRYVNCPEGPFIRDNEQGVCD